MILLIDAYNVLKQVFSAEFIDDRKRKNFIGQLGRYAKKRQHKIVLVFDGGPYDRATKERISGVYVVYSGSLESADDYIKRYLKENKELDLLLISSDRDLRNTAKRFNIESMQAPDFYKIMQSTLKSGVSKKSEKTKITKIAEGSDQELDERIKEYEAGGWILSSHENLD